MILHHKDLIIDKELIKFKKGFKYSDNISFIPIRYIAFPSPSINLYLICDAFLFNTLLIKLFCKFTLSYLRLATNIR